MLEKPTRMLLAFDSHESAEEFLRILAVSFDDAAGESLMSRGPMPMQAKISRLDVSQHYTPINKLTWGDEEVIFIAIKNKRA